MFLCYKLQDVYRVRQCYVSKVKGNGIQKYGMDAITRVDSEKLELTIKSMTQNQQFILIRRR
mgnify:CR=1 FL=1